MNHKILIIEDEMKIARLVALYLEEAGFNAVSIHDGAQALAAFRHEQPALVILDLNLPGMDGLDVARAIRRESDVPIIMLTARTEEVDKLVGLEIGADDYVTKPFSPREVVARARAVLRRVDAPALRETLSVGGLTVDLAAHRVTLGNIEVELTPSEFDLLALMAGQPGRAFNRMQLLEALGDVAYEGYERSIDQHVKNLRKKFNQAGYASFITTVHGVGYRLEVLGDDS